jgi:hypothetical protein
VTITITIIIVLAVAGFSGMKSWRGAVDMKVGMARIRTLGLVNVADASANNGRLKSVSRVDIRVRTSTNHAIRFFHPSVAGHCGRALVGNASC